jgi:uncharacterized protein YkwD
LARLGLDEGDRLFRLFGRHPNETPAKMTMNRRTFVALAPVALVAACASSATAPVLDASGKPAPQVYRISGQTAAAIPFRMLDSVNSLRGSKRLPPLAFNAQLNAAAATHARDMSVQNRPWHFGSDGSSPLERVQRVGYRGRLLGELISETYETELETLAAWSGQADTRAVIMDPMAREMGFAWFQEGNGKIWWTLVTGG